MGSLSEKVLSVGATLKPTDSPVVGIITLWVANPKIKVFLPGPVASPSLWKAGWQERWPWGASSRPQWPPRRPPQGSRQRLEYSGLFPGDVRKAGLPGPLSPVSPVSPVGGTAGYLGFLGGCGRPDEPVIRQPKQCGPLLAGAQICPHCQVGNLAIVDASPKPGDRPQVASSNCRRPGSILQAWLCVETSVIIIIAGFGFC